MKVSPASHRFTLIEMLVVVSVIAILASLLLPALAQARAKARAIDCVNNTKQNSVAYVMYTDEYDGHSIGSAYGGDWKWYSVVAKYQGLTHDISAGVFNAGPWTTKKFGNLRCPGDGTSNSSRGTYPNYAMNSYGNGYPLNPATLNRGVDDRKLDSIRFPDQVMMLGDGKSNLNYSSRFYVLNSDRRHWILNENVAKHPGLKGNYAMADGHVESFSAEWLYNEAILDRSSRSYQSKFFDRLRQY